MLNIGKYHNMVNQPKQFSGQEEDKEIINCKIFSRIGYYSKCLQESRPYEKDDVTKPDDSSYTTQQYLYCICSPHPSHADNFPGNMLNNLNIDSNL